VKIRKLLQGLVAVSALCVGATSLHAQGISVFAMGSVSSLYNGKSYLEHSVPYESNYKTGGGITLGAEWRLNRILGVEGAYSRVRNNLTLTNVGASPAVESGYGIHDQRFSADLVAHAPTSFLGLKPYLAGGPEYDHFSQAGTSSNIFSGFTNAPLGAANKLGLNYGGGLDWGFLPHIALRVDVRDHVTTTPTYGFPSSSNTGPYFPVSGAAHDLEYSAGIVVRVGK